MLAACLYFNFTAGKQRLPHHADSELASCNAEKHLRAGRHGEWMPVNLPESQVKSANSLKGTSWGVSTSDVKYVCAYVLLPCQAHSRFSAATHQQNLAQGEQAWNEDTEVTLFSTMQVTLCPPGISEREMTPGMYDAIRRQHLR